MSSTTCGERVRTSAMEWSLANGKNTSEKTLPLSGFACSLLTDMYQLTMAYGYWVNDKHKEEAVFDLFFRSNPFHGEFTIFAGLNEVLRAVSTWGYSEKEVDYVRTLLPQAEPGFFTWLSEMDASQVKIYAIPEGSICYPRIPLIRVEGPLGVCQLMETTLLCLVNYSTLMATNAARFKLAAGPGKRLLEFGLRRAQGTDGAISASRYSYMAGFDGTSNVLAGHLFGSPVSGTMAHAFIQSFKAGDVLPDQTLPDKAGKSHNLLDAAIKCREELGFSGNDGELIAFVAYAKAFPNSLLALVDTYNTLQSGVPNFLSVAFALHRLGYRALGIRLDSGDLPVLSKGARNLFCKVGEKLAIPYFSSFTIVASNDINEANLKHFNSVGHEMDAYGIGTNLVTCQSQPALGGVYKLVSIKGDGRIKLSEDIIKVSLPGRKEGYRLYGLSGKPKVDLLQFVGQEPPKIGDRILLHNAFKEDHRIYITPTRVEPLHLLWWDGKGFVRPLPCLETIRKYVASEIEQAAPDQLDLNNPHPYPVMVTKELYDLTHRLWLSAMPIPDLY